MTSIIVQIVRKPMESLLVSILARLVLRQMTDSVCLNKRIFLLFCYSKTHLNRLCHKNRNSKHEVKRGIRGRGGIMDWILKI